MLILLFVAFVLVIAWIAWKSRHEPYLTGTCRHSGQWPPRDLTGDSAASAEQAPAPAVLER